MSRLRRDGWASCRPQRARATSWTTFAATGEGFHGLVALDFDGDGAGDLVTWVGVGPDGFAIADQALANGPACRGITDFETYVTQCLGG